MGYVEFQDQASARRAIEKLQGHLGLGGKGLFLEAISSNLAQLTGTPAAGTGGVKRPREDGRAALFWLRNIYIMSIYNGF